MTVTEPETQDQIAERARAAVDGSCWTRRTEQRLGDLPPVEPWRASDREDVEREAAGLPPVGDEPAVDMVNHPPHYRTLPCGVEPIAIVEEFPYSRGAAIKYLIRAGEKGGVEQEIEDLRKAAWYCEREAQRVERMTGGAA